MSEQTDLSQAIVRRFQEPLGFLGGVALLAKDTFNEIRTRPFYGSLLIDQIYLVGVKS